MEGGCNKSGRPNEFLLALKQSLRYNRLTTGLCTQRSQAGQGVREINGSRAIGTGEQNGKNASQRLTAAHSQELRYIYFWEAGSTVGSCCKRFSVGYS